MARRRPDYQIDARNPREKAGVFRSSSAKMDPARNGQLVGHVDVAERGTFRIQTRAAQTCGIVKA
ncbi:MAG: hypothetical protein ABTD50_24415 [Polyangiaceae bacterium]